MKRVWILLVALLMTVLLCCGSCGETKSDETSGNTETGEGAGTSEGTETGGIAETSESVGTSGPDEETGETGGEEHPTSTTETIPETYEIIGAYTDILKDRPFESFMDFSGDDRGIYYGKSGSFVPTMGPLYSFMRVRVVGMKEGAYVDDKWSVYYVQVTAKYNFEDDFPFEVGEVYTMYYAGTPENPLYGRPPLEIGKEYLRVKTEAYIFADINMAPTLMMPIEEVDGVEYVYAYGVDMGELRCAITITDEEENQIYKPGKHDGMIAQVLADGEELPTFGYKCELAELIEEPCAYAMG